MPGNSNQRTRKYSTHTPMLSEIRVNGYAFGFVCDGKHRKRNKKYRMKNEWIPSSHMIYKHKYAIARNMPSYYEKDGTNNSE